MVNLAAAKLNEMLRARASEMREDRIPTHGDALKQWRERFGPELQRSLGLFPIPPRSALSVEHSGTIERDGYRIERLRFCARLRTPCTAHLYLPSGTGPFPVVVSAHGADARKKAAPWVQARGIGFALQGTACLILDSPGAPADPAGERGTMGDAADPRLVLGLPALGLYVWELIRSLDAIRERKDIELSKAVVAGEGTGAIVALCAFALEQAFHACIAIRPPEPGQWPINAAFASVHKLAAFRSPAPLMVHASESELDAVVKLYRSARAEGCLQLRQAEGPWDFDRRDREAAYSFVVRLQSGAQTSSYTPELRPLTDGRVNGYESGTVPSNAEELVVGVSSSRTLRELLHEALESPYPGDATLESRMVPWGKFGRLDVKQGTGTLTLSDEGEDHTSEAVIVPTSEVDPSWLARIGLSYPEFLAQLLHQAIPGGPEGWEASALTGDAISSMIASVKTLVGAAKDEPALTSIRAFGPVASQAAAFLSVLRPGVIVDCSHKPVPYSAMETYDDPLLLQPGLRYMKYPFSG